MGGICTHPDRCLLSIHVKVSSRELDTYTCALGEKSGLG